MGDPCGMPFFTGLESDIWPSRQIAISLHQEIHTILIILFTNYSQLFILFILFILVPLFFEGGLMAKSVKTGSSPT